MSSIKVFGIILGVVVLVGGGVGAGMYLSKDTNSKSEVIKSNNIVDESGNKRPAKTKPSPDKATWYIKDYVGRNASDSCSFRINGDCMEDYGDATLTIKFITEDSTKVTKDNVGNYIVTDQSVAPDTQINLVFADGYDYVESQNIEEIILNVKSLNSNN